jgi:Cu2+-exporting ATPase
LIDNQKGSFHFEAEKVGEDTLLSQIINMVKDAQGSKAPVQKLVDKIAGIFVPVVLIISIISLIVWLLLGEENALGHGIMAMVTVLIIACPCALGLATPTAIMVGVGKGAEQGILIKDAESLETAHKVNAVLLDNKGTITEGKPQVNAMIWANDHLDAAYLKKVLITLELSSEHPLADSVVKYLQQEHIEPMESEDFQSLTGLGATAKVNNKFYFIGNRKLMENQKILINDHLKEQAKIYQAKANTNCSQLF